MTAGARPPTLPSPYLASTCESQAYADAIAIFHANVDLFPDEANPYDSLAEAYLKSGDKAKALEYYQKVLEIDPNFPSAVQMVAKLKGRN